MLAEYTFECAKCGQTRNDRLPDDAHTCVCGEKMALIGLGQQIPSPFEPYYSEVLKEWVYSEADKAKKYREHRSESHPEGFHDLRDDMKFRRFVRDTKKYREDIKASRNPGYKPGLGAKYDYKDPERHKFSGSRVYSIPGVR